jgi:CIC family chloride channel protein
MPPPDPQPDQSASASRPVLPRLGASGRWTILGLLVGVVAGLGAVVFHLALHATTEYLFHGPAGYHPPEPLGEQGGVDAPEVGAAVPWLFVLIPTVGGLLAGLLIHGWCPEAGGEGTNGMIRAFHRRGGLIQLKVLWVKLLASVFTIGSGGSAGREGPSTQIGGAVGSTVATLFRLSERDRRVLLLAGASAGVGAIFRAPLGGALFAGEVLYRDTDNETEALIPCLVGSIVAYAVFISCLGTATMFHVPEGIGLGGAHELLWYGLLGAVCAVVGRVYVRTLDVLEHLFKSAPLPGYLKPAVGGALLGTLALGVGVATGNLSWNVLGGGHGLIQAAMDGLFDLRVLAVLLGAKIVGTGLTVGSGGSGGLFAPSLVVGALLGGLFGGALVAVDLVESAAPFVLVGMASFFAGIGKVPITAVILVSEITRSYELLAPSMLATACAFQLARSYTLFGEQVTNRLVSPAHAGDFVVDVLEQLRVRDVFDRSIRPTLIPERTPLARVLILVAQSDNRYFPVVDDGGRMTGIFSLSDIRRVMTEAGIGHLVLAKEIATEDVLRVTPDEDLATAMKRFTVKNIDELPVVDPEDDRRVLGLVSRKDVIAAYGRRVREFRQRAAGEDAEMVAGAPAGNGKDEDIATGGDGAMPDLRGERQQA